MASAALAIRELVALLRSGVSPEAARQSVQVELNSLNPAQSQQFETLWQLSRHLGSAPASALERLTAVFETQEATRRKIETAFAAPRATARLVTALPVISLLLAQLAGLNPVGSILGSAIAALAFVFGVLLLVAGNRWSQRMIAKSQPRDFDPGAYLDSVNLGLQAGLPPEAAIATVELKTAADAETLDRALHLSRQTGAELGAMLVASADRIRAIDSAATETRVAQLGVNLMLPLGLTVLPAFVLLAIVPIALAMLSAGSP